MAIDIGDIAKAISKWGSGSGSGFLGTLSAREGELAQTLAESSSVKLFNGLDLRATKDITLAADKAAGLSERKIAKGGSIHAANLEDLARIKGTLTSGEIDTKNMGSYITDEIAKKNKIDQATKDQINSALQTKFDKYSALDKKMSLFSSGSGTLDDEDLLAALGRKKNSGVGYSNLASAYFSNETPANVDGEIIENIGTKRANVALGTYMGGAMAARFLSGGDLTHNSRGENDIVGIPMF